MIKLQQIQPVSFSDTRGRTYEIWKGLETKQLTFCSRNINTSSGNHYHLGKDPSKNPERVLILSGQIRLRTCNGLEISEYLIRDEFTEVLIPPLIAHVYFAETNTSFIEQRTTAFDCENPDTYHANSFRDKLEELRMPFDTNVIERFLKNQDKRL